MNSGLVYVAGIYRHTRQSAHRRAERAARTLVTTFSANSPPCSSSSCHALNELAMPNAPRRSRRRGRPCNRALCMHVVQRPHLSTVIVEVVLGELQRGGGPVECAILVAAVLLAQAAAPGPRHHTGPHHARTTTGTASPQPATCAARRRPHPHGNGLRNRVPPHVTTQDWLILILILTTVVAQRIIVAADHSPSDPASRTPRCRCRCTHLLALLRRRAALSSLEHGCSRRDHVLFGAHVAVMSACTFCVHFPFSPTLFPPLLYTTLFLFLHFVNPLP